MPASYSQDKNLLEGVVDLQELYSFFRKNCVGEISKGEACFSGFEKESPNHGMSLRASSLINLTEDLHRAEKLPDRVTRTSKKDRERI